MYGLFTCNHVIPKQQLDQAEICHLSIESIEVVNTPIRQKDVKYKYTSEDLDATFIALSDEFIANLNANGRPKWLTLCYEDTLVGDRMFIVQHPKLRMELLRRRLTSVK